MTNSSGEIALCSDSNPQSRDAVILFHGITGTPREMEELATSIHSSGFDCFAPRLSGHCSSIEELSKIQLETWLKDTEDVIAKTSSYARVHVIGQSFGSLLALHLALEHPDRIASVVALSLPWSFNSKVKEITLELLSFLPNSILDLLGYQKKTHRDGVRFRQIRHAYPKHSIAGAARVMQLRRSLSYRLTKLRCPVLLLQDPLDHHLAVESVWFFRRDCPASANVINYWMYGGYHELSLGPCYDKIARMLPGFFENGELNAS